MASLNNKLGLDYTQLVFSGGASLVLAGLSVAALVSMAAGVMIGSPATTYVAVAILATLIPLFASVAGSKKFDLFEPITLIAAAIFFGTTIRAIWLVTSEGERVDFIMMGTTFEEINRNAPLMLLSIFSLTLGYVLCNFPLHLERFRAIRDYKLDRRKTYFILIGTMILSLIGIGLLMRGFNINFSGGMLSLSMKRVHAYVSESGEIVYGTGTERFIASAAQHGLLLLSGMMIAGVAKLTRNNLLLIAMLAITGIATPFLTSSRSTIVLMVIDMLIVAYYYKKLKINYLVISLVAAFFVLAWMGSVREANMVGSDRGYSEVDRVLGSGNSLDLVRTSAIMDRVPGVTPFEYGRTYLALLASPIPRQFWLDKPQVGLGPYVKGKIFGEDVRLGGWPSGMVAEGWINFGVYGLFVPLFLFGAMLRVLYESCRPFFGISLPITLIYAVSIWRLGFGTVGMNFAHGMTQTFVFFVPMLIILIFIRARDGTGQGGVRRT